jgi:outer membrane protein insertion porin family
VSVSVPEQTPDLRRVVLTAETGPRVRVEAIEFEGNRAVDAERLRDLLETKPGNGPYRPEVAAADAERIRRHYLALGYPDARVPAPRADLSRDGTSATLRYSIAEGDPSRVSAVRLEGNEHIPAETLLPGVPIKPGDPYLRGKVREGAEAIRLAYDRAGYADAKVSSAVEPGAEPVLVYRVEEGPRRIVGGIVLEGNLLARKEVIERELTFKPGAPLSQDEILRSQRALYRTGMFRSVDIRTEPGSDPGRPIVRIRVTESPNLTQSVGVGYDSDEGVRGLYEITNANLFGRNRTIGLQLRGSAVDSRIQALIKDPYLFNRRLDSLLSSYWERQERESFTLRTVGSTLQVSNRHGPHDRTIYRYTLKDIQLSDLEITEAEAGIQSLRLSTLAAAFVHDSRDDFLNPRRGSFASFDLGASGRGIGSEAQFVKFFSTASLFVPLLEDSVWAQSARIGLSEPFGETELVPISERFFAGGDTTVRGFRRDELGPEDPVTGNPTGGEALIILNQELRFPIWRAFRGVVFFDAGNVVSRIEDLGSIHLRPVLGTGFRIDTPIGPFRIEYGRKLDRREDEDRGRLHLSIGQAF